MKVMQLLSSLKHDESERGIFFIAHTLIKEGHRSVVVAGGDKDDELFVKLSRDGSTCYNLAMPKKSWWALLQVLRLKHILHKELPDVIHLHSRTPAWVLHWSLKLLKNMRSKLGLPAYNPKIVATVYGFYPINAYSRSLFEADILIAASKSIERYLTKQLEHEQIVCVRRGVDVRLYPYRPKISVHWLQHIFAEFPELEHKKWLVFPTRLGNEHGQEWLIDIIGNLKERFPKIHIIVMDNDSNEGLSHAQSVIYDDFSQRLSALGLRDFVSFVGKNPVDLRDWLASAQLVLALANHPESIGMTALQAIHLGTPVLGWDKGAFGDILSYLYPQGLIKHQNANALVSAVAYQLETKMRPVITHDYEVQTMVDETLLVYHGLMNETAPQDCGDSP